MMVYLYTKGKQLTKDQQKAARRAAMKVFESRNTTPEKASNAHADSILAGCIEPLDHSMDAETWAIAEYEAIKAATREVEESNMPDDLQLDLIGT